MIRSAWAKTARPTSRSNITRCCAPLPTCMCSAPATQWKPPSAGSWRSNSRSQPSALLLSRQNLPTLRTSAGRQLFRPRRLCDRRSRRPARCNLPRDRLGSVARRGSGQGAQSHRQARRGGFDAVLGPVRRPARGIPRRHARLAPRVAIEAPQASAGTATSASMARSSACTALAPAPRRASSISTSASRSRRRSQRPRR